MTYKLTNELQNYKKKIESEIGCKLNLENLEKFYAFTNKIVKLKKNKFTILKTLNFEKKNLKNLES